MRLSELRRNRDAEIFTTTRIFAEKPLGVYRWKVTRSPISETLAGSSGNPAILLSHSCGTVSSETSEKNAKANAKTAIGKPFICWLPLKNILWWTPCVDDRVAILFTQPLNRLSAQLPNIQLITEGHRSNRYARPRRLDVVSFGAQPARLVPLNSAFLSGLLICGPGRLSVSAIPLTAETDLPILRRVIERKFDPHVASRCLYEPNNDR